LKSGPNSYWSELQLKPTASAPPTILFELHLLYDDTSERVTLESLNQERAMAVKQLSEPDIFASLRAPMRNGKVSFHLSELNTTSAMTEPRHRRFRYKLVCVDQVLKISPHLHCDSPAFYVMSKLKKMGSA
jgi:hypothetical protein